MEFDLNLVLLSLIFLKQCYGKENTNCIDYTKNINYHHPIVNLETINPLGKWVSSRCEIVPDKKFIVRRLDILETSWNGFFYHYSDSWCTKPTFITKITGSYEILPATATPNTPVVIASSFDFERIYIRSKSSKVLDDAIDFIERECPKALPDFQLMQSDKKLNLDNFINQDIELDKSVMYKKRCRYYFGLHYYSYKKIRMSSDKTDRKSRIRMSKTDTLYFADIPPYYKRTKDSKFDQFQYGLSRIVKSNCQVCTTMKKLDEQGDINAQPILPIPKHRVDFSGDWVSETCEMSEGSSASRYYHISRKQPGRDYGTITMYDHYFHDEKCSSKEYTMINGGTYRYVLPNEVADILTIEITFTSLAIIPYSDQSLHFFRNSPNCGDATKWAHNIAQNLTKSTKGCPNLGLILPSSVRSILRVSGGAANKQFYILQRGDEDKGKYFTDNLIPCSYVSNNLKKPTTTTTNVPLITREVIPIPDVTKKLTGKDNPGGTNKSSNLTNSLTFTLIIVMVTNFL